MVSDCLASVYPTIADPTRPAWHFGPPAYWMNDPNGVCWHEGWCHLFYQHNPHGDAWAEMHWGHARSRDLIHWEHLPLALRPRHTDGEHHCYSGCLAFNTGGSPRILYTSVPPAGTRPATQVLARPDDTGWHSWTQQVATPILDLATHGGPDFGGNWRDPFVFRTGERTFLILGATLGEETVIPLYENPSGDLQRWVYRGILHRVPRTETPFLECPNLIRFGEKWLLLTSPCRAVEWCSGTLDLQQYGFHVERRGRVDEGADYYATHPAIDPSGRVVLFGWVRHFPTGRGWNGCLGVPRRIWLDAAGDLCSEPVAEIAVLGTGEATRPAQALSSALLALPLPTEAMCDGEIVLERDPAATVTFSLAGVTVGVGPDGVRFDDRPPVPLADGGRTVRVRWLLDRSLLELFVNERATYTHVIAFPLATTAAHLSVTGGPARMLNGRIWTLHAAPSTFT